MYRIFVFILAVIASQTVKSQDAGEYSYLRNCFLNSFIDTADINIKGIGDVRTINFSSGTAEETGLIMFSVPVNKRNKSVTQLATAAANFHIALWKNNSRVVYYKQFKSGSAAIIEFRLHMLIEDIYMQMIVVSERNTVYETVCFRNNNDTAFLKSITSLIIEKKCLPIPKIIESQKVVD